MEEGTPASHQVKYIAEALRFADVKISSLNCLKVLGTNPIITHACENSISMLKLIKIQLCSSVGQDRLNELALMYQHQDKLTLKEVGRLLSTLS